MEQSRNYYLSKTCKHEQPPNGTTDYLEKDGNEPIVKTATKRSPRAYWLFKSASESAEVPGGCFGGCWFTTFLLLGATGCNREYGSICCNE
jgi:hypothetical protein